MEQVIGVVNQSSLGAQAFRKLFNALVFQIERDYNLSAWVKEGLAPKANLVRDVVPSGAWGLTLLPQGGKGSLGLEGWHEVLPDGTPAAFVNYALTGRANALWVMSHEALELLVNSTLDRTAVDPATGITYRREVCDPVEETTYEVQEQKVADFCLPSWFGLPEAGEPRYTCQRTVDAPFTCAPGGKINVQYPSEPGVWQEIDG